MEKGMKKEQETGAVVNPCKACAPLGASLAMKGISRSMCILHGSQGCATYIRRFFIGHFREPVDIASSSFDENTAVFGGRENLMRGVKNIIRKYNPEVIGIATSCLAETIGEDLGMYIKELERIDGDITFITTDTAAYKGTHVNGFMKMTSAAAELAQRSEAGAAGVPDATPEGGRKLRLNIIPWMVSPGDIRYLKSLMKSMDIEAVFLPDYSLTMDGTNWTEYEAIPRGGTTVEEIRSMGLADHTIQFGPVSSGFSSPAEVIKRNTGVDYTILPLPIGLRNTDAFLNRLIEIGRLSGRELRLPDELRDSRGRLLDAYSDSHKYFSGISAAVYGETDFTAAMASFLCEIGVEPAVCMTGEKISSDAADRISEACADYGFRDVTVLTDSDFTDLDALMENNGCPYLMIGNSKGYKSARHFGIPLIRAGFPIQDRFGGQRLLHLGYEGALRMTDEIANTIISKAQAESPVGYMSM